MASAFQLSAITSIATVVTPRARAAAIRARNSAEPTPWPCHASATTEREQGGSWPDRSEEPQVAGLHGQAGEEGLQRPQIAGAHRPDQAGVWAAGRARLGSDHRLSVGWIAESVK
jgi:hypothetical protein